MKERFYAGIALEKDLQFCAYMEELRKDPRVFIINEGERVLVHETEYTSGYLGKPKQIDTGRTHEGYASHYVTFLFGNFVIYMQAADHYPFTDENHPGAFNFIPYAIISPGVKMQADYYLAYSGISSVEAYCAKNTSPRLRVPHRDIDFGVRGQYERIVAAIVKDLGGYREKAIWDNGGNCIILRGETWNAEHQVMRVISRQHDADGHRDTFEVDLVCGKICG